LIFSSSALPSFSFMVDNLRSAARRMFDHSMSRSVWKKREREMFRKATKMFQIVQKSAKLFKKHQIVQKAPNCSKSTKLFKKYQIVQKVPNCSKSTKLFKKVPNCSKKYQIVQKSTKLFKRYQKVPICKWRPLLKKNVHPELLCWNLFEEFT
jgi:hypothetical protein